MYKKLFDHKKRLILELTPRGDFLIRTEVENVETFHEFTLAEACDLASVIFRVINQDPELAKRCADQVALREKLKISPAAGLHDHSFKKVFTVDEINDWITDEVKKLQMSYVRTARRRRKIGRY